MKLRYSAASPYVRKVMVVAIETGQDGKIDRIPTVAVDKASGLDKDNPLVKVPSLTTDDGEALYDSAVICEYLDSLHGGRKLFPASGKARWTAIRRQALADGMLDAGVLIRLEGLRKPGEQSADFVARQTEKVKNGLDALEKEAGSFAAEPTIGEITVACCLGWLEFRKPTGDWRPGHPKLAAWLDAFSKRPSMSATVPKA